MSWVTRSLFLVLFVAFAATLMTYFHAKATKVNLQISEVCKFDHPKKQSINPINYSRLGEGVLGSKSQRLKKDLQDHMSFLGANTRPDYPQQLVYCKFKNEPYEFELHKGYSLDLLLSEDLSKAFKFKVSLVEGGLKFEIFQDHHLRFHFLVPSQQRAKDARIDQYKLDHYLLVRQKATWVGADEFLKDFGGKEHIYAQNSQRVDFAHLNNPYSIYAKEGSSFVWKDGKWQNLTGDSQRYPLMQLKKTESGVLHWTIWDTSGQCKEDILLKLSSKEKDSKILPLKYIGAKSSEKWLLKSNKERILVEPGDWLLHLGHKWEKMDQVSSIDRYLSRINLGELFIVEEFEEKGSKKYLKGKLYNALRSQKLEFKIDVTKTESQK